MAEHEEQNVGRFSVEFTIANNEEIVQAKAGLLPRKDIRRCQVQGVVDSGAARLVLPQSLAREIGLEPVGRTKVRYADQRMVSRNMVRNVWLELLGREGVFSAILEPKRETALIGAIVLEELDLLVDCVTGKLQPRDPKWIISEIEWNGSRANHGLTGGGWHCRHVRQCLCRGGDQPDTAWQASSGTPHGIQTDNLLSGIGC